MEEAGGSNPPEPIHVVSGRCSGDCVLFGVQSPAATRSIGALSRGTPVEGEDTRRLGIPCIDPGCTMTVSGRVRPFPPRRQPTNSVGAPPRQIHRAWTRQPSVPASSRPDTIQSIGGGCVSRHRLMSRVSTAPMAEGCCSGWRSAMPEAPPDGVCPVERYRRVTNGVPDTRRRRGRSRSRRPGSATRNGRSHFL